MNKLIDCCLNQKNQRNSVTNDRKSIDSESTYNKTDTNETVVEESSTVTLQLTPEK